ncbi:electron transfer flavoprotein alpha subunit [Microbotryum lychnidis-dioicae p1A1 Lamole]|uniref:Probable electron transfer flavoprotein subunit alpha n=1 Tax=Microbotryum lychnidis-dioicae (strain p1A1 Lamole / MvSl-1064) TaxID=683840 RepID=U5H6K6_USTV1|nr:electron transfer flavoprotein alpha subunit [Microbotryum lychnidis-dioicae p1A1 Lamole]|eukprot:KDE06870.1 electron transfer flavoprotein alpha subunit [Microbotryum lychnidis-dioicae p1A1 Lamole]
MQRFASASRVFTLARRSYATPPSPSALVLIEHKDDKIVPASLNAITAARKLGGTVTGLVVGEEASTKAVVEGAQKLGLDALLHRTSPALAHALAEPLAPVLAALVKSGNYTHLTAAHSAQGKNIFPRVAGILGVQQISDVMAIESPDTFVRPIYAGNAIATVKSSDSIKIFTVRSASWDAAVSGEGATEVDAKAAEEVGKEQAAWVSEELTKSERPDLGSAQAVVSGGRGVKSKESFDSIIFPLADALGAAVGASRAAVDSGYADNSQQVGQTGKVVAPSLYVAVGISGALQHLAGMKDSKTIVAINKDPDAPIFQVADHGLVADLFEAVPELTKKVEEAKK